MTWNRGSPIYSTPTSLPAHQIWCRCRWNSLWKWIRIWCWSWSSCFSPMLRLNRPNRHLWPIFCWRRLSGFWPVYWSLFQPWLKRCIYWAKQSFWQVRFLYVSICFMDDIEIFFSRYRRSYDRITTIPKQKSSLSRSPSAISSNLSAEKPIQTRVSIFGSWIELQFRGLLHISWNINIEKETNFCSRYESIQFII